MRLSDKVFRTRQLVKKCLEETEQIKAQLRRLEDSSALPYQGLVAWSPEVGENALFLLGLISPLSLRESGKVRLGGSQDGGYVVPEDWRKVSGLLSLGIGPENTFDLAFAESNIPVHAYDFSISRLPQNHPKIEWFREKVSATDRVSSKEISLGQALARFKEEESLALKMDIEGYEYPAVLACPPTALKRIRFLVGEFHGLATALATGQIQPIAQTFQKLKDQFEVVHVHANNHVGCRLCGGVLVPQHLEITWANKDVYSFGPCREIFPTELDRPNQPGKSEIFLGNFQYHQPGVYKK